MVERTTVSRASEIERLGGAHVRIVQPGDTIYGIAFANGLDANRLAAWNKITDTSRVQVGQRLRLTEPAGFKMPAPAVKKTQTASVSKPNMPSKPVSQSKSKPAKPAQTPNKPSNQQRLDSWRWPTKGKVVARFNPRSGQQGINIAGKLGQPVIAARSGEVVYVGNGLKGYGNLVIIKHDERFISAYAHNQETFVREGEKLNAGQRVATMGEIGQQAALHFQIRVNGEPVQPVKYLP